MGAKKRERILVDCACGICGIKIENYDKKGRPRHYVNGHNGKGKPLSEEFRKRLSEINKGRKHTEEARKNMSESKKGKITPIEVRKKISQIMKERYKTQVHHMVGKKIILSPERLAKFRERMTGENSPSWKGDNVGYTALHGWVRKNLPKVELCQLCNKTEPKEIACITGIYNREFKNWARFCHSCHKEWDNVIPRLIINRKKRGSKQLG